LFARTRERQGALFNNVHVIVAALGDVASYGAREGWCYGSVLTIPVSYGVRGQNATLSKMGMWPPLSFFSAKQVKAGCKKEKSQNSETLARLLGVN